MRIGDAATSPTASGAAVAQASEVAIKVKSAYSMDETVMRTKEVSAKKRPLFFAAVDQQSPAAQAAVELPPSVLLMFGNPALRLQFITAKGKAGLDWPVRLPVQQDDQGSVRAIHMDFGCIARRHHIADRDAQRAMASGVAQSITSTVKQ
jgi:uncharacterized protein (DUF302 family)